MAKRADYSEGENALSQEAREELARNLADRKWRLCNLYTVENKDGVVEPFRPNWAQLELLEGLHWREVILKARQLGFTTFIQIFMLDACLFNSNTSAGTIAHSLPAAREIMEQKVRRVYARLPEAIKRAVPITVDNTDEIKFGNGSRMRVSTSHRSGTLHLLHVSEFGKIAARRPDIAREIITGAFPAAEAGIAFIESTAEGQDGKFFDICETARLLKEAGAVLTRKDFNFRFFPWYREPRYRLAPEGVAIPAELGRYFDEIEKLCGVELDEAQRAWYAKESELQGTDMRREYPSAPKEAFEAAIEGAYFTRELERMLRDKRVCRLPWEPDKLVHLVLDLGIADFTAVGYVQKVGRELRLIEYEEYANDSLVEIFKAIELKPYRIKHVLAPHDIEVRDYQSGQTRRSTLESMGYDVIPCPNLPFGDQINAVRIAFPRIVADESKAALWLKRIRNYKRKWNEANGRWMEKEDHDEHSHGGAMTRYLGVGADLLPNDGAAPADQVLASWQTRKRVA